MSNVHVNPIALIRAITLMECWAYESTNHRQTPNDFRKKVFFFFFRNIDVSKSGMKNA